MSRKKGDKDLKPRKRRSKTRSDKGKKHIMRKTLAIEHIAQWARALGGEEEEEEEEEEPSDTPEWPRQIPDIAAGER